MSARDLQAEVDLIGREHEALALALAGLDEAAELWQADPAVLEVGPQLERLWAHLTVAFAREERAMRDQGYPLIADHLDKHAQFLESLAWVRQDGAADGRTAEDEIAGDEIATARWTVRYVRTWFAHHSATCDRPLIAWLQVRATADRASPDRAQQADGSLRT
jgi:hemerythrin